MYGLVPCTFYFDESYHDRKIRISDDAVLNIWKTDRAHDKYVGCFVGWANEDLSLVKDKYVAFEAESRHIFCLSENKEVKSQIVRDKQYVTGVTSFSKQSLLFYTKFFEFLYGTGALWQANIVSKIEMFLRDGLKFWDFRYLGVPDEVILYTIAKFFESYADDTLLQNMAAYCNGSMQPYQFVRIVNQRLDEVLQYDLGVNRKSLESAVYKRLQKILRKTRLQRPEDEIEFDYQANGLGLKLFILEYPIIADDVSIFVDNEQATFDAIVQQFPLAKQADSDDCFGVRVADVLAGFIARMLHSLNLELSRRSPVLESEHASEEKLRLSVSWVDFRGKQGVFEFYKLAAYVMIGDDLPYWTVMASNYADEVCALFSLFRYVNQFDSFDDYMKVSVNQHWERLNNYIVSDLEDRLNGRGPYARPF